MNLTRSKIYISDFIERNNVSLIQIEYS